MRATACTPCNSPQRARLLHSIALCAPPLPAVASKRREHVLRSHSVQHTRLISRNHVLDVDEGIFTAVDFEHFERLDDEVTQRLALLLRIINPVAKVLILRLEEIEDRQYLTVVWHKSLTDHLARHDHLLQHLEHGADDLGVARVQGRLDWNNQLRDHGQDLRAAVLQHVVHPLHCKEAVWLLLFAQAVEEDWEVMVVVKLLDVDLPADAVVHAAMLNLDGMVATLIEAAEFCVWRVGPLLEGTADGRARWDLQLLADCERRCHATVASMRELQHRIH